VNDVALPIDHYVSIVSVLDCKQVGEDAVRGETSNEVSLRFFELVVEIPPVELVQVG
jgi:hypothetical protein